MPVITVMKFGGTSLKDKTSLSQAISHIRKAVNSDKKIVVVVSAMGRINDPYATDTLIRLLRDAGEPVSPRELDMAMSCGETLSTAFFTHLLTTNNISAKAFTGSQAGILTEGKFGNAEIKSVNTKNIHQAIIDGVIPVITGFQGVNKDGEIQTLGRGGSDTSAVALGAALGAEEVEIYTDVDGIACADPHYIPTAPFLDEISASEILMMAEEGSRVLHPRAVRTSLATKTPIRVRNTFNDKQGTLIHHHKRGGNTKPIALAHRENQVLFHIKPKMDPLKIVPDLLDIGNGRYLLKNDVYTKERQSKLRRIYGHFVSEKEWATASVILSGEEIFERSQPNIAKTETLPSTPNCWRYLLREKHLTTVLGDLFQICLS